MKLIQELLLEFTKIKLGKDPDDFGATVLSDDKPEKVVNIPMSKIILHEPETKVSKGNAEELAQI